MAGTPQEFVFIAIRI